MLNLIVDQFMMKLLIAHSNWVNCLREYSFLEDIVFDFVHIAYAEKENEQCNCKMLKPKEIYLHVCTIDLFPMIISFHVYDD